MVKFKLYPSRTSRKFFEVRIYDTQRQMQKVTDLVHPKSVNKNRVACTQLKAPSPRLRNVGAIYFFKDKGLQTYIVAHEIDHAVTMWIGEYEPKERRRIYTDPEQDEFRASMVDWMHDQFWGQLG